MLFVGLDRGCRIPSGNVLGGVFGNFRDLIHYESLLQKFAHIQIDLLESVKLNWV